MAPGELGVIGFAVLASGAVQAAARMRDEMGVLRRLKASGATEAEAGAALETQAERIRFHTLGPVLSGESTIAEACAVFVLEKSAEGLWRIRRSRHTGPVSTTSSSRSAGICGCVICR
ncbi:hypothetical protein GCM10027415_20530 [Humibacter ginsengisoli]